MRTVVSALALLVAAGAAQAQIAGDKVRIGVMSDLSGVYESGAGMGSVEAVRMAVEEFGGKINGKPIEVLAGDHQNKPDTGVSIANRWYDVDKVDVIAELVNSAVAFAVLDVTKQKNKMVMLAGAGSADFTGKACAPGNSVHWVYDTYQLSASIAAAVPQLGKKWYFISADYAFGAALEAGLRPSLTKAGVEIVGAVKHPLSTQDFSSFVLQAQNSGADVIALNNGGDDTINGLKAIREFGLKAKVVGFGLDSPLSVKAMGLEVGQGAYNVSAWVNRDDAETKAWIAKFIERRKVFPGSFQVGVYSAVKHYLKAVEAANTTDTQKVIEKMRELPVRDIFTNDGYLRPDGRMVHSVALTQIKSPAESKGEWDLTKTVGLLKGDDVFRPIDQGGCPALK
ncbi:MULTISPECIES: ABC transporter substrate-binding protein [unclassified Beijerinckia]|uniref:ABC transporter substrate-binding protein n=1 Tax=unclassified Beijerinckia TaxID=2638183 RepID=UPI000899E274|nr:MULTISPECIES: ABC transporter substrate-binding protein [unclassified Beijerinckia]MDH7797719.1 branched-chain amino acid transport system substrate-binding protein [Beijerinckia sp. GAS462]SEC96148.1 branched-chain amino acid transport system substrate-binding protein [Beijerinckia sp. 28-YEA-48]